MDEIFARKQRLTLMAQALEEIRNAIVSGKLKPGDRLVETALAEQLHMSRFPIREAIRTLEKEGLVETTPFKGTHVVKLHEKDMEELYALRGAIESLALQLLIRDLTNAKIDKIESIINSMELALEQGKISEVISGDLHFHRTICELSGNRRLFEIWNTLENHLHWFLTVEKNIYEPGDHFVATHYPVLEAIKQKDPELAVARIKSHLDDAIQQLKSRYWPKVTR
ncbi:MAG: GntR family transcriptional regulator [Deltaproteobacteria bacterium]|nr:GntR family transcriptional regulator [Deltaproteobacteria bacterium]